MCVEKESNNKTNNEEKPIVLDISEIVDEGENLKTFFFDYELNATPGQFIMLWLPGVDLKPFSISYQTKEKFGVTVYAIGDFTKKLMDLKVGDKLGIQGPYGKGYTFDAENSALVGGGSGTASVMLLADKLSSNGKKVNLIVGARTKNLLLHPQGELKNRINTLFCTDDGSYGFKGFTTQALRELLQKEKIDMIYTCGPEIMMKKVMEISDEFNIPCEVSMERYMKCGFGVCGQCVVDNLGIRTCKDGPVITKEIIKQIPDFGKYKRASSGKKIFY